MILGASLLSIMKVLHVLEIRCNHYYSTHCTNPQFNCGFVQCGSFPYPGRILEIRRNAEQRVIGLWVSFTRSVHLKKETRHQWRMIVFSQKGTYKVFELGHFLGSE